MAIKQFYNAQEAMKKLGVSKTKFYEYVNEGRVNKKLDPNRQRGALFPVREIDELAAALRGLEVTFNSEEKQERVFRVARPEDAPAVSDFSKFIFERLGGSGTPVEILEDWFKIPYLEVGHLLLERDEVIGYATILPLNHDQIMQIMNKEIKPARIPVSTFQPLIPGKPIDLFIGDVAVHPGKKHAAAYLLGKLLTYLEDLGKQGVEIEGIYSTASTREGINISRRAGMKQMDVPGTQYNWIPFELKIQETKNSITKDYIRALNIYKRKVQRTKKA